MPPDPDTDTDTTAAPYGYDVCIVITRGERLITADWYGGSDPYIIADVVTPDGTQLRYRTHTVWRSVNPRFDEYFELANVAAGTAVHLSVHDKDTLSTDDPMGSCHWAFNPWPALTESQLRAQAAAHQREEQLLQRHARRHPSSPQHQLNAGLRWRSWQGAARRQSSIRGSSVLDVDLPVDHPAFEGRGAGRLHLQVAYRASAAPGAARMRGPVRFRQNLCPVAGLFLDAALGVQAAAA